MLYLTIENVIENFRRAGDCPVLLPLKFQEGRGKMLLKMSGGEGKNFRMGGDCPVSLPLVEESAIRTFQRHFETRTANAWDLVQHGQ